jgi:hypothetical protein
MVALTVARAFSWRFVPELPLGAAPRKRCAACVRAARSFTFKTAERQLAREDHYTIFRESAENLQADATPAPSLASRLRLSIRQRFRHLSAV